MIKVLISYDMRDGQEQECQEFVINKVAPALAKLGFNVSDVWFTVWGKSPQILSGGEVDDMTEVRRIFLSTEWGELAEKLESLTENFRVRIVPVKDE
jgi:hypothetical protein